MMKRTSNARALELEILKLVVGGNGLAFSDGKAVFVPGVMPGERIRALVTEEHVDYDRARCVEILSPSPKRREPPCPLAGVCGGCDWLHISYPEQLALKRAIVTEALSRVGGVEAGPLEIVSGPPLCYRNRAQIHRDREGRLGFMGFHTNEVVPVESCPVSVPAVNRVFSDGLGTKGRRVTVFGCGENLAVGSEEIAVTVCGKPLIFSADCFFQSNLEVLEKLVPFALEGLGGVQTPRESGVAGGERAPTGAAASGESDGAAADLYCGVGVFAARMAAFFRKIILVESDPRSVSFARRNVSGDGPEFNAVTVEKWIQAGGARESLDAVIVDPPREGLSRAARDWLSVAAPRRLVYVSCNPVTLARDLKALVAGAPASGASGGDPRGKGGRFRLIDVRLFDFFPQTSHVETVARLERAG